MIRSFGSHVRRNLIAYAALFFALGGTSFAAVQALPRNSVGSPQIKNRSIQRIDISKKAAASLRGQRGPRGLQGAKGDKGDTGSPGAPGAPGAPNPNAVNSDKLDNLDSTDFGRVAWAHQLYSGGSVPEAGQTSFSPRNVGSVTIKTGGTSGNQFVILHGKLGLYTNSAYATYCPTPTCSWRIELIDSAVPGTILDDAIWRPHDDSDASTMSVHAVVAAPAGTTKTYTLRVWYEGGFATGTFTKYDFSLVAETSPFGATGGGTLGVSSAPQARGSSSTER